MFEIEELSLQLKLKQTEASSYQDLLEDRDQEIVQTNEYIQNYILEN